MPELRLLSLRSSETGADAARTIDDAEVDVACLHGAPGLLRWRSRCAAIARSAGMVVVAGGRTTGGALLLSSLGVDVSATRELPLGAGPRPPGAALARMSLRGSPFVLVGARLPAGAGERLRTAVGELDPTGAPVVVALDGPDATRPWDGLAGGVGGAFYDPRPDVVETVSLPGGVRVVLELP